MLSCTPIGKFTTVSFLTEMPAFFSNPCSSEVKTLQKVMPGF